MRVITKPIPGAIRGRQKAGSTVKLKKRPLNDEDWYLYSAIRDPLLFSEFVIPLSDGTPVRHYHYQCLFYLPDVEAACTGRYTGKSMALERQGCHGLINYSFEETLFIAADKNHLDKPVENIISTLNTNKFLKYFLKPDKREGSIKRSPSYRIELVNHARLYGVLPGGNEGAGGASNIEGFHVARVLADEGSMLASEVAFKLSQAVNEYSKEHGSVNKWYGTPSELMGSPFQERMEGRPESFAGNGYNFSSALNPSYSLTKYRENLQEYGGSVSTPGYRRYILGLHALFSKNVFNMEDYVACLCAQMPHPYYIYRTYSRKMLEKGDNYLQFGKLMEQSQCTIVAVDVGSSSHTIIMVWCLLDNKWWLIYRLDLQGITDKNVQRDIAYQVVTHYDFTWLGYDSTSDAEDAPRFKEQHPELASQVIEVKFNENIPVGQYEVDEKGKFAAPVKNAFDLSTSELQQMLSTRQLVLPQDAVLQNEVQGHAYMPNGKEAKMTKRHNVATMKVFALTKYKALHMPKIPGEDEEEYEGAVLASDISLFGPFIEAMFT